jgi:hypothetical protein
MIPPPGFIVQVISAAGQKPNRHAAVICLDIDGLGSIAAGLAWAREHQQDKLFVAAGRVGGDMTALSEYSRAILSPPKNQSPEGWRHALYDLWFLIEHPEFVDPPSDEPGGVSREEFDEHLRALNSGDYDEGGTC